jgi:hypothetical protein
LTLLSEISLPGSNLHDLRAIKLDPPTFRTVYVVYRSDSPVRHLIDSFCAIAKQANVKAA